MSADFWMQQQIEEREQWELWVCPYCGEAKSSPNGTGSDVSCCGEVGHAERNEDEQE